MGNGNEFSELGNSDLLLNTWKSQSDGGNYQVSNCRQWDRWQMLWRW